MSLGMALLMLSVSLSMAARGGISDALGAPVRPPSATPVLPSSAATPPSLRVPGGGTVPDAPAGSPRNPDSNPLPAPAAMNHYAGAAESRNGSKMRGSRAPARSTIRSPLSRAAGDRTPA